MNRQTRKPQKPLALLTALALLLTLWAPMAVSAEAAPAAQQEELFYFGRSILEKMENGEALCYVYDKIVDACEQMDTTVDLSHRTYTVSPDEVNTVRYVVTCDRPEYFWISKISMRYSGERVISVTLYPDENTAAYRNAVAARVKELTVGLEDKSDYEKSLILHDRVANAVRYQASDNDQTVIGSLLEGAAVCAGYAHAYQILMQAVGIPCFYVAGYSSGKAHAWNLVMLDGDWYYTDVTWDDQTEIPLEQGGGLYYTYLNNTFDQMEEDHTAEDFAEYLPRSTATAHNFYVKNGLVVHSSKDLDVAKFAKGLTVTYPYQFYVVGDTNEGINKVFAKIYSIVQTIAGKSASPDLTGAGLVGRGVVLQMEIAHTHGYETTTTSPSCTVEGVSTDRCTVCGHTTQKTVAAQGHEWVWHSDETHHTSACGRCDLVASRGEHVMDGNVCTDCGYVAEVQVLYGDANGDGTVNNRDVALLQQYVNGWNVSLQEMTADANGDGTINNRDVALLQQYVNGWSVTLGPKA